MELPSALGPYRLIRRLGHGGMAQVFEATFFGASGFEKRVAVKTLLPELQGDGEFERLLIEEARLGAWLSHRNLVQVHDLGVDRGIYYVRMDYVDGSDLASLSQQVDVPVTLALLVAEELALALEYVHSLTDDVDRPLGLVHRDVSPSNVLISRWGEVKLADFGIAKATMLAETTAASIRRGKYAYMSPEQIGGRPLLAQSDQFGFGVMLMELLTGSRPFDGDSPVDTMDRIKEATPPDLGDLDANIGDIILRCLARDPERRFPSPEALRQAIATARRQQTLFLGIPDLGRWVNERLFPPPSEPSKRPETRPITKTRG